MTQYKMIRDYIDSGASMLYFQYHDKEGHVDPYGPTEFLLWFEGEERTVHSLDEVMNTPFWDGKSLAEIAEEVTDITW